MNYYKTSLTIYSAKVYDNFAFICIICCFPMFHSREDNKSLVGLCGLIWGTFDEPFYCGCFKCSARDTNKNTMFPCFTSLASLFSIYIYIDLILHFKTNAPLLFYKTETNVFVRINSIIHRLFVCENVSYGKGGCSKMCIA